MVGWRWVNERLAILIGYYIHFLINQKLINKNPFDYNSFLTHIFLFLLLKSAISMRHPSFQFSDDDNRKRNNRIKINFNNRCEEIFLDDASDVQLPLLET